MLDQTSSVSGLTTNEYDANGSQVRSVSSDGTVTAYGYNVRNKMVAVSTQLPGEQMTERSSYVYDDAGHRTSQTTGSVRTDYLTAEINPTQGGGYSKPVEEVVSGGAAAERRSYILGDRVLGQKTGSSEAIYLIADGHGSTRALVDASGVTVQTMDYDAFGNALDFDPQTVGTPWLFAGDGMYDAASGVYWHGNGIRARQDFRFLQMDTYAGSTNDPISLHKYLYANANPISYSDPSGNMSLVGTMVTAGIKAGLMGMLIGSPFRAYKAAMDVYAGASFRDIASEFVMGAATDFALGAVLGGGAAGLVRQFGSNAFKIRAVGQSLGQFISARVPWSAWRLAASARGFAIERTILNRTAGFLGRQIRNFPVIDDYIMKGGRGIASSVKSLDLTLPSYANPAAVLAKLNQYADDLARFATNGPRTYSGFTVGNAANPITDRVLIVAIEEGAATSAQANMLVQWVRQAPQQFPNIRVLFQTIP